MSHSKTTRGCWTCKDRKVACDRQVPHCQKCIQTGRRCLGYGTRLSWPRKDDRKRAVVSKDPHARAESGSWFRRKTSAGDFINVYLSDIELSRDLSDLSAIARPRPNPRWIPFPFSNNQFDMFTFYTSNVAQLLPVVHVPQLQNLIMQISFSTASPASSAIMNTIYGLSSLHLDDPFSAVGYRSKAMHAMWASAEESDQSKDPFHRVVAGMFLALFETLINPHSTAEWSSHILRAKAAAKAVFSSNRVYEGELRMILDWIYYYHALTKYGVRHHALTYPDAMLEEVLDPYWTQTMMNTSDTNIIDPLLGCSVEVLCTISCLIDTCLFIDTDPVDDEDHHQTCGSLQKVERRLKTVNQQIRLEDLDDDPQKVQQIIDIAELCRLSGLIYCYRSGPPNTNTTLALQQVRSESFQVLRRLKTCQRTFPLFVVGCEARGDEERAVVLRIIEETRKVFAPQDLDRIRGFLERFWALDDLDEGGGEYARKLTAVLEGSRGKGRRVFV